MHTRTNDRRGLSGRRPIDNHRRGWPRANHLVLFVTLGLLIVLLAACGQDGQEATLAAAPAGETPRVGEAYPAPELSTGAYPGPSTTETPPGYPGPFNTTVPNFQPEPPNPDRELPDPSGQAGVVGGVLIYEEPGLGYVPLAPVELVLGEILYTDGGEAAYIRKGADSPRAEILPAGVFIFPTVAPGDYGLVVDLGYTEFTILEPNGTPKIITIESGKALDLGQVITQVPGS